MRLLKWLSTFSPWADEYAEAKQAARLQEDGARVIAERALQLTDTEPPMRFSALVQEEGDWVWVFVTRTRGQVTSVKVRDRDGKVVGKRTAGIR